MEGNKEKIGQMISLEILRERAMKIDPQKLCAKETYELFLLLGKVDQLALIERLVHQQREGIINILSRLEESERLTMKEDKAGGREL